MSESPPTLEPGSANGSTLIPAEVLPRLSDDVVVDLVWFADRPAPPSAAVLDRCRTAVRLPLRPPAAALAAQASTRLPRATWQRQGGRDAVRRSSRDADVVYLHGLHVFGLAADCAAPVLAHEVDPWSRYWSERAAGSGGPRSAYDRSQARRARRLERSVGSLAARYLVVNADDAQALGRDLGRHVDAVPNGVDLARLRPRTEDEVDPDLLVFVGTLDYPPNVLAVTELCERVLPLVRQRRPRTRLVVAGRRPVDRVRALAGDAVEVLGQVDDVRDVFARGALAVYPGDLGRGTKNTVLEALAVGCPVVCSPEAARGAPRGPHLLTATTAEELADRVVELLDDPDRRAGLGAQAARAAHALPDWDAVAAAYERLLREAASVPRA